MNFPNIFQNSFFYKSLLISFCISMYYLVFQEITSLTSACGNVVKKYEIFHNLEKQLTVIISLWELILQRGTSFHLQCYKWWLYRMNSITYLRMMLLTFHVESCVWYNYSFPNYRRSNRWEKWRFSWVTTSRKAILKSVSCPYEWIGVILFFEKHHLAPSLYNWWRRYIQNIVFFCALFILLFFLLLDHANDWSKNPFFQLIRIN